MCRGELVSLVLRRGMVIKRARSTFRLLAATGETRALQSYLNGISNLGPVTFGAVTLHLSAVVPLVCYIPALHASRVDPMNVSRYE